MQHITLVTGAGRGIGAAAALALARAGHDVVVNYARDAAAAERVATQVRDLGRRALVAQADVADEAAVMAMFERIDVELGRLSGLVNNAGIVAKGARLDEMEVARWRRMWDVNLTGAFLCAREAVRRMSTRHGGAGGSIVNLSSAAAKLGAGSYYVDYAASKGGIDSFTVGLARELALEGVRVNGVRPGIIDTEIHADAGDAQRAFKSADVIPMRRPGTPAEVAQAIVWLMSDAAGYVTGTTIDVSGGR